MLYIGYVKSAKIRQRAAGIYVITNVITGARYYGSAMRVGVRRQRHFYDLRAGSHMNPHLQAAWNKYGADAFTFSVLAYLEKDELLSTEQRLLDRYAGSEGCYNMAVVAGAPMAGRKHSAATKARLSEVGRGRTITEESRARYSAASKLRPISDLARQRALEAKLGKKQTPEHIAKKAEAVRGNKQSAETIAKRMAKVRGRKDRPEVVEANRQRALTQWASPEARLAQSDRCKGRTHSDETRAKMAAAHKGIGHTTEARDRMAEIKRQWWAAKKAAS
jgi:group I intron endonuclease